jgi:hypothetical protein
VITALYETALKIFSFAKVMLIYTAFKGGAFHSMPTNTSLKEILKSHFRMPVHVTAVLLKLIAGQMSLTRIH